jgi:MFS family permease
MATALAQAQAPDKIVPVQNRSLLAAVICVAQFMIILDEVGVNIALPSIGRELGMPPQALQWILNIYILCFGGFLLVGGRASDLLGKRRMFTVALAVFGLASLAGGVAWSGDLLIAARAAQGVGAAALVPSALALLTNIFRKTDDQQKAFALWGATSALGATSGVVAGGLLTGYAGWRFVFFISVPFACAAFLLVLRLLPADATSTSGPTLQQFDIGGALSVVLGLLFLVHGIISTHQYGWLGRPVLISFTCALALLTAFVLIETRASNPLLNFSVIRNRFVWSASLLGLLQYTGPLPIMFFVSMYLQNRLLYSATRTGFIFLPLALTGAVSSRTAMIVAGKLGTRRTVTLGFALMSLGHLALFRLGTPLLGNLFPVLLGCVLTGAGVGLAGVPITAAVLSNVEPNYAGVASGLISASQRVGGALMLAILITVFVAFQTGSLVNGMHAAFLSGALLLASAALGAALLLPPARIYRC